MKKTLLITLGISALISLIFPPAIILGLFLGIIPGIILLLAPTTFLYYASALGLGLFIKEASDVRFPTLIALTSLLAIGCLASFALNVPIYNKMKEYESKDFAIDEQFKVPDIIAIYSNQYMRHGDSCNSLCQGLLFNKSAKKVLIITDPEIVNNRLDQLVTSYEIQQDNNCTNEYVTSKSWDKIAGPNVKSRIAAGECLVKRQTKLLEAEVIFFNDNINLNEDPKEYKSFKRRVVSINYIELLKDTGNKFDAIYRYSKISAQPFAYPLSFGYILGAGGGNMSLDFGFFHLKKTINSSRYSHSDPIQEFKPQMRTIFGKAIKPINPSLTSAKQLFKNALNSDAAEGSAGLSMIENHLRDLSKNRVTPTDEDMRLVIQALKNDRVNKWSSLGSFTQLWYDKRGSVPNEYIEELANQILRNKNIGTAAGIIHFLPDGDASNIYPKLEQITQDKILRNSAYSAITRLGDGGIQAVPKYIQILEEYETALEGNLRKQIRELGKAPIGAMIGLCRMSKDALPAKEILFALIKKERPRSIISKLAVDALINMGLVEELRKDRYQLNKGIWREIQGAISDKKRAKEKGKRFCGRRVI